MWQFFVSLGRWLRMFSELKRWQHDKHSDQTVFMGFYQFYRSIWGSYHEIYRLITSFLWWALVMTLILQLFVCQRWCTIHSLPSHFSCFWFFPTSNFIALQFFCSSLLCSPWVSLWTPALPRPGQFLSDGLIGKVFQTEDRLPGNGFSIFPWWWCISTESPRPPVGICSQGYSFPTWCSATSPTLLS